MKGGRWLRYTLHAVVLAGLVWAGMKYLDGAALQDSLDRFDWRYAPPILALSVAYVFTKGWRFVRQVRMLSDAPANVVMRGYIAGQACTVLPAGMTARAALLKQAGIPVENSAASIALASFSDQVVLVTCSLVSALWFQSARPAAEAILVGLVVLAVLLGVEASRAWLVGCVEWLMGKINLLPLWKKFLESIREAAKPDVILASVGNAAAAFALMVWALDLSLRGVGTHVSLTTLILAFTLPAMLGRISAMPGGMGVTEAGMIGILDAAPGVTAHEAAAATLIFRVGTILFAALVGAVVYLFSWRPLAKRHAMAEQAAPTPSSERICLPTSAARVE